MTVNQLCTMYIVHTKKANNYHSQLYFETVKRGVSFQTTYKAHCILRTHIDAKINCKIIRHHDSLIIIIIIYSLRLKRYWLGNKIACKMK